MRLIFTKKILFTSFLSFLFVLFIIPSGMAVTKFDGKAKKGDKSCTTKFKYDTQNRGKTFLSWKCAEDLGLGTINQHGTPDNADDDTFDVPDGTPSGMTNNGALTFWKFADIEVCVTGSNGEECCLTVLVWVVKNRLSSNKTKTACGLLNAGWINGVKACSIGAGCTVTAKWKQDVGPWDLEEPKTETKDFLDSRSKETRKVFDIELGGPLGSTEIPMVYGSLSDWTIIPKSAADRIGLVPTGTIDLTDEFTLEGLLSANMNLLNQTQFEVATLPILATHLGPDQSGQVLINNDENSDCGILGGAFMDHYVFTINEKNENYILGYDNTLSNPELIGPTDFELIPSFPNPFSDEITISYSLAYSGQVTITIVDIKGAVVKILANEVMPSGVHSILWNAQNTSGGTATNGIYFVRLEFDGEVDVQKIELMK